MYIPITFLGAQASCIECLISGSYQPDNVAFGNLNDEYFWIRVNANGSIRFTSKKGAASNAKMLVVGGGGYAQLFNSNPLNPGDTDTGGGGAGQVIFKDFSISPNVEYFASASIGGRSASQTGGESTFIENYVADPVNWIQHTAVGGDANTTSTGGDSGDGFTGGTGGASSAGGGGAGSTGNGQDRQGSDGGDGGDGYTIPSPFDSVVLSAGTKIAGGGPGDSYLTGPGAYASGVDAGAYGNGASGVGGNNDGNNGVVFLFFPISGCETGSRIDLDFEATGGSIGTFDSGSVRYKYHIFTTENEVEFFNVTQGATNEARIIAAGGGAGSSAESYNGGIVGGGAGAGGVEIQTNVSLFGYTNLVGVADGGAAFTNGGTTNFDSIIHSGQDLKWFGGGAGAKYTTSTNAQQGASGGGGSGRTFGEPSINIGASSNRPLQGNDGGNGYHGIAGTVGAGGGGGGAGGVGNSVTSSSTTVAAGKGGDGFDISTGFYSYLTGSFSNGYIGHGGGGTGGEINGAASSSFVPTSANDGSGAQPNIGGQGNAGFLSIVYPISGSVTNSAV
jgi:hypothetical protein